jgi:hypothetical protein
MNTNQHEYFEIFYNHAAVNSPSADNPIRSLEELKDRIISAISASTLDDAVKTMWSGDAREMYYGILLLNERLTQPPDTGTVQSILHATFSRHEQVCSELRTLNEAGQTLEQELRKIFSACQEYLSTRLPRPEQSSDDPPARILQRSPESFALPCSVCGAAAVEIHPAGSEEKILRGIICAGITRSVGLDPARKEDIFRWLASGDLAALHAYMEDKFDGGLDAYCPACDRIYCRTHYNVREEFDEGFYDCARGVCPEGHTREIDD